VGWTAHSLLRVGIVGGTRKHATEPSGFIKYWEVPKWLSEWQLVKDSAPSSEELVRD
jgi:hypothetical protein